MHCENVLKTIGNTPLIHLGRMFANFPAHVFAKVESFNPGQSAKDRIALFMIEEAERKGLLKPGSTIVEATSGNTGFGLAMVSAIKGYKCVLTVSSKASKEKLSLLRSLGAEVVVCPSDAAPEDPRSYYARAEQLAREIPNSYYVAQNFNLDNSEAHYRTTGPEIWEQTQGKITHFVCCVGTGGTMSGTARFLKEQNPDIQIIGVDAYGSVLKKYWQTGIFDQNEIYSYKVEGLGKTIIPDNIAFDLIDDFIKVTDKDSALRAREAARKEGMLIGYSSGSTLQCIHQLRSRLGKDDLVVALFSDHGSRYLGKIFNDDWMRQQGFLQPHDQNGAESSSYESMKRKLRAYRLKYKKYLRQTMESLKF